MRQKPHILYWVRSLMRVQESGGDVAKAVSAFEANRTLDSDSLKHPKRTAVFNLLEKMPSEFLTLALQHVDDCGSWEQSGLASVFLHVLATQMWQNTHRVD